MKISVVTISFNQSSYIREAIESVISQNHPDIEYVIIDAGSTDGSREIILEYKEHFKHVIFEPDKGPADGLNKGLSLCTGDIFCYLNADDRFVGGSFRYVINFLEKNSAIDGIIGAAYVIDKNGIRKRRRHLSKKFTIPTILNDTALALQQATFLRLPILRKHNILFNIANSTAWDAEFLIDFCIYGGKIFTIDKTLGEFRIYPDSITGSQRMAGKHKKNKEQLIARLYKMGYEVKEEGNLLKTVSKFNIIRLVKSYLK